MSRNRSHWTSAGTPGEGGMVRVCRWMLALAAAFPLVVEAGSFVFGLPERLRSVDTTETAIADFNSDGRDDLAALVEGRLQVRLQGMDGTLGEALVLQLAGRPFTGLHAADLAADGTWQVLAGHAGGLAVYHWTGTGFRREDHPSTGCLEIASGDLDGDARPDVVCLGAAADAALYYTRGTTGFAAPAIMQTAVMGNFGGPRLKDVTGDGKPDLLLAGTSSNSFYVYANDGGGGFQPGVAYTHPEEVYLWPSAIEALDVDEDGRNEVVVGANCNMPCARLYFHRLGEQGYLEPSHSLPTLDNPDVLLADDVNGDGHGDLLVGHVGWSTIGRYMGRGPGEGLAAVELWSQVAVQQHGGGIALGDLDDDGDKDLAVANSFGVNVLRGGRPAVRDLNNDFSSDLLWRNGTGQTTAWYSADSGREIPPEQIGLEWLPVATADFDADAYADILWRHPDTGEVWHRTMLEGPVAVGMAWRVAGAGDFDGDGRGDLFWRNTRTGANSIWRSADPKDGVVAPTVRDLDWKVAGVGDFDGDGRSDLLWRNAASGRNAMWRSASDRTSRTLGTVSDLAWTVAGIGDFDGDGRDDIVWHNVANGANTIWKSANSATPMPMADVASTRWRIGAVGDYDGDGRSDLMWRHADGTNVIWRAADSSDTLEVAPMTGWEVVP